LELLFYEQAAREESPNLLEKCYLHFIKFICCGILFQISKLRCFVKFAELFVLKLSLELDFNVWLNDNGIYLAKCSFLEHLLLKD